MEPSSLRLQHALRECSFCFLSDVANGASLVWVVPRSRNPFISSDFRELSELYDDISFREVRESLFDLNSFSAARVSGFDQKVAQMLAGKILDVINCGRLEYEHGFRCIVLQSTLQQVLSKCPVAVKQ